MSKSVFCKWVDLPWYFGVVDLLAAEGIYPFDPVDAAEVTVAEFLDALEHPEVLPLERQRALALFAAGTEWESKEIQCMIANRVKEEFDVFMEIAGFYSNDKKLSSVMHQTLSAVERQSPEECIFALIPLNGGYDYSFEGQLLQFVRKFSWYSIPVCGNERLYYWLVKFNETEGMDVELLRLLAKVVACDVKKDSITAAILRDYGFRWIDLCRIAFQLRIKLPEFSRSAKKNAYSRTVYHSELALCTRKWGEEDKEAVTEICGRLDTRICSIKNYTWFYEEFGYSGHEKELSINFSDKLAVKRRRNVLSETEFNLAVLYAGLQERSIAQLGLTFSEWDPRLSTLVGVLKPDYANELYYDEGESLPVLVKKYGIISAIVNYRVDNTDKSVFDKEEMAIVERNLRDRMHSHYLHVVNYFKHYNGFELSQEAEEAYNVILNFGMDAVQEYGVERLKAIPEDVYCYSTIVDLMLHGLDFGQIPSQYFDVVEEVLLQLDGEITQDTVDAMASYLQEYDPQQMVDLLNLQESTEMDSPKEDLCIMQQVKNFMHSSIGNEFMQWTSLTKKQLLYHWDRAELFLNDLYAIMRQKQCSLRYCAIVKTAVYLFVNEGSAVHYLNECASIQSLTNCSEWCEAWLKIVEKPYSDFCALCSVAVNRGLIGGVQCWLTDVGIIAEEAVDTIIPCWVVSEDGEMMDVFVGVAFEETFVPWLGRVLYHSAVVSVKLKRVN